jgi:hypothetical protein
MRARNRIPTFVGEVTFGFVVSLVVAAVASTSSFVLPAAVVGRLVIAAVGLTLVVRAIARSDEKTGRVVTVTVWLVAAAGVWLVDASLPVYFAVQVMLVWLIRSLYAYSRLIEAGLDLGLTLLALSFAVFAAVRTDSVFLACWSFLLLQALHVAIPGLASRLTASAEREIPGGDPNRGFNDAFKAADEALHRIAGRR